MELFSVALSILVRGVGLGSTYALLAVGFVIIYRATDVVNFAQPALMILGAYFTALYVHNAGLPFPLAVVAAMATMAVIGALTERVALRPMVGEPPFAAAMVTVGVFFALFILSFRLIGPNPISTGEPWGFDRLLIGDMQFRQIDVARTVLAMGAIGLTGLFLQRSKAGLAMRATAMDQETALAQGVNVGRMFGLSWAISGALAALAGVMISAGSGGTVPLDAFIALKALPVIILGGLDSIKGSVVAGLIIGVAEVLALSFNTTLTPLIGENVHLVVPYFIMILALMVRPYGLFGTAEVQRV